VNSQNIIAAASLSPLIQLYHHIVMIASDALILVEAVRSSSAVAGGRASKVQIWSQPQ
jgi:hypothetical protein